MNYPLKKAKTKTRAVENLSARVYSQIKHLILCNEIMPGQKRSSRTRRRLGVIDTSASPTRSAGRLSPFAEPGLTLKELESRGGIAL